MLIEIMYTYTEFNIKTSFLVNLNINFTYHEVVRSMFVNICFMTDLDDCLCLLVIYVDCFIAATGWHSNHTGG
jgi:hypothetical protein